MKNKKIMFGSIFTIIAVACGAIFVNTSARVDFFKARANAKEVMLDDSLKPTITDGTGVLQHDYSTYRYTNASNLANYHVVLGEGGTISKDEATKGLTTVNVVFTGDLRFECGFASDYETQEVVYMEDLTSATDVTVSGNYWKITALADTNIESITLNYSCDEASSGTIDTYVGLVTIPETLQLANLEEQDGTLYFSVNCGYDKSKGRISASNLSVRGDNATTIFPCSYIKTTSEDTFTAYFDVSSQHTDIYTNKKGAVIGDTITVYTHLFIDDVAFNTTTGADGNGNIGTNSTKLINRTMTVDGNKAITFGLRNTGTRVAWLQYQQKNIVDYNPFFSNDPSVKENDENPFANVNGGSSTLSNYQYNSNNGAYYGGSGALGTKGKTFTTSVVVNKATNATFKLIAAGAQGKTFGYEDTNNTHLTALTLNSDTTGVTPLSESVTFGNNGGSDSWYNYLYTPMATLALKAGLNEISFTISDDQNINLMGVSYEFDDTSVTSSLYRVYDNNYSPSIRTINSSTYVDEWKDTSLTSPRGEWDPFFSGNGGSYTGARQPGFGPFNYGYEGDQRYRYGEIYGYTFTITIYAKSATTVVFRSIVSGNTNRYFSATESIVSGETNYAYLSTLKLNDTDVSASAYSTIKYKLKGWTTYVQHDLATLSLNQGVNTITFAFTMHNTASKLNLRGVAIESAIPIKLGSSA